MMGKIERIKTIKNVSLKRLLEYENPEVVARFCKDLGVSKKFASTVFKDMLRYLYLDAKFQRAMQAKVSGRTRKRLPKVVLVTKQMLIIDEMWHSFVLYTKDYTAFSHKYFGIYIHHVPAPALKQTPTFIAELDRDEMYTYLKFIQDELGEDVVERWFVEYPRFNKTKILQMQLKAVKPLRRSNNRGDV